MSKRFYHFWQNEWPRIGIATFFLFTLVNQTFAQGLILDDSIRDPSRHIPQGISLPIRSHEVSITVREQAAVTTIDQVFYNPHDRQVEGTYVMAIPENASISNFKMEMDGEPVQAEILDKDKAEKIYQEIVRKQKDPGILSFSGRGLIRARIFPIPAKSTQKIQIRYEEILSYDKGTCRYQYALASDKLCKQAVDFVKISAKISSDIPIRNIYSPSHELTVSRDTNFEATAKYSDENVTPDQDFLLLFSVTPDPIGLNVLTYKKNYEDGFFLLLAAPQIAQEGETAPKDVIFVLDRSGSMKQNNKIKQAKDALEFCIRSLHSNDRLAVVTFSDEVESLVKMTDASKSELDRVCGEIQKIEATGGTNIDGALESAFSLVSDSQRPTYILFLTDGLPTVGNRHVDQILDHSKDWNKKRCRVFTFGVGYDVNTILLDQLSQTNKGISTYVKPTEDIEVSVSSLYSKISDPALADVKLDFGSIEVGKMYPKELPDLFSGSQLVVLGRYKNSDSSKVTLTGNVNGQPKSIGEEFSFTSDNTKMDYIPRLWAARRIGYLMNEIRLHGKNEELIKEIVDLSRQYGILTEYTSFLVTESPLALEPQPPGGGGRGTVRPMDMSIRSDISERISTGVGGVDGMGLMGGMGMVAGKEAVAKSETMQNQLQNAPALSSQNTYYRYDEEDKKQVQRIEGVRYAGQQTFFNQGENWISTQFDDSKTIIQVKPFSDAYFQLSELAPEVSQILALAQNVTFMRNGIMVQIDEKGLEKLSEDQLNQLK